MFFFNDTATTEIYTLSLHDALPICSEIAATAPSTGWPERRRPGPAPRSAARWWPGPPRARLVGPRCRPDVALPDARAADWAPTSRPDLPESCRRTWPRPIDPGHRSPPPEWRRAERRWSTSTPG